MLELDREVEAVARFMQERIPADRLTAVAKTLGRLAPLLWDRDEETARLLTLAMPAPTTDCGPHKR